MLVADQASKWWVLDVIRLPDIGQIVLLPVLNLTMVWNRGVTFGLLTGFGQWSYLLLAAVALAVVAALGVWLRRAESRLVAIALGAIVGGALSNVIDRLRFGAVVDFIHAHVGPGPGMCSTSPTPPSFAAWRRWCSTACCRARGGPNSTG